MEKPHEVVPVLNQLTSADDQLATVIHLPSVGHPVEMEQEPLGLSRMASPTPMSSACFSSVEKLESRMHLIREVRKCRCKESSQIRSNNNDPVVKESQGPSVPCFSIIL